MTYRIFADSFHHFLRVAISDADSIYAFKLFDLTKPSRITGLYSAQIQRIMPSLHSVWVKFDKDKIGFLKSPKRSYIEGEWIAIEVLKDQDEEKKYLVKERSDLKFERKFSIIKEPQNPFWRLCEILSFAKIGSVLCSADIFSDVQDIFKNDSFVSKLELYKGRDLFHDFDLQSSFDAACQDEVSIENLGSLLIEEGRTLTSIDLNMKGEGGESTFERAAFVFNLKACDSVWEQIRHRNLGGLIVVDFVRMQESDHRLKIFQK